MPLFAVQNSAPRAPPLPTSCTVSPSHSFILNTNAATSVLRGKHGMGLYFNSNKGLFVAAAVKGCFGMMDACVAEGLAIIEGLKVAVELGFVDFWIQSNCKQFD